MALELGCTADKPGALIVRPCQLALPLQGTNGRTVDRVQAYTNSLFNNGGIKRRKAWSFIQRIVSR